MQSMPNERFDGARVRALRKERNLTQSALCKRLGWEQYRLSRIERNRTRPYPDDLAALKVALGVRSVQAFYVTGGE